MAVQGAFSLTSASDLREKLRHDFAALTANPFDPYLGFNFFVTAEHVLDWQYPGYANDSARKAARQSELLLQITSHIAAGAKHFVAEAKHHTSVASTSNQHGFFGGYFGNFFGGFFGRVGLVVALDGDAAVRFGPSIGALALATQVLAYWDAQRL